MKGKKNIYIIKVMTWLQMLYSCWLNQLLFGWIKVFLWKSLVPLASSKNTSDKFSFAKNSTEEGGSFVGWLLQRSLLKWIFIFFADCLRNPSCARTEWPSPEPDPTWPELRRKLRRRETSGSSMDKRCGKLLSRCSSSSHNSIVRHIPGNGKATVVSQTVKLLKLTLSKSKTQ